MTREEFTEKCKEMRPEVKLAITPKEYSEIEYVYEFHPSISETEGKSQIAYLYLTFGMALIRDMKVRAEAMDKAEARMRAARIEMDKIKDEIQRLREGREG